MSGLTFVLMFLVLIALVVLAPMLLRRWHVPMVVAMMIVGIVVGPQALDLVGFMARWFGRGYSAGQLYSVIDAMGLLGLLFLMALAGLEVNLKSVSREKGAVASLSLLTFFIPAAAGYFVYSLFLPADTIGKVVYAALFASHSVGIVFPVIREMGAVRTRFGVAVLASTVITDLASLVLFAVAVQLKRHSLPAGLAGSISVFDRLDPAAYGNWFYVLFFLSVVLYVVLVLWTVPSVVQRVFSRLKPDAEMRLLVFLLGVLVIVTLGEVIGVSIIVGAFVAGMAFVRSPGFHEGDGLLHRRIEGIGYGLLVPFLFLNIGMKTDLRVLLVNWQGAAIVLATVVGLVASKVASGWLALRICGFSLQKSVLAGLMTVPQLSATLAAAAVALELKMLTPVFFNAIVGLSILTTIPVPTLVRYLIHRWQVKFDPAQVCPPPPPAPDNDSALL